MTKARFPKDEMFYLPLGGVGEIGMNLYAYGYGGKWIIVDMGVTFGDDANPTLDLVMADPGFLAERADDVLAIVITHGHEDHVGAVPLLWDRFECPVYATPFTAEFLRHKLKEYKIDRGFPLNEIALGGSFDVGPFSLEYVGLTHSIPEPNLLRITTDAGTVVHTGDYKFDDGHIIGKAADFDRLAEIGQMGVAAMIGDSTNVFTDGSSGSEEEVYKSLITVIGRCTGKVAVSCFASNMARVTSICKAAKANGRHVVLAGRSLWRMTDVARTTGYLDPGVEFLTEDDGGHLPDDKILLLCTGSQGEPMAALARIAFGSHRHISMKAGDTVIFSSRVIPGNEKGVYKIQNQFARIGVEIITDRMEPIHCSGHPGADEVRRMYDLIKPACAIPAHGERIHLNEHARIAESFGVPSQLIAENGSIVRLLPGEPEIVDHASTGRLAYDGGKVKAIDCEQIRTRKRGIYQGQAMISLVIDEDGVLIHDPLVSAPGLLDPQDDERLIEDLSEDIALAVERLKRKERLKDERVEEVARTALRRTLHSIYRKKPVTTVHLLRV